MKAKNKKKPPPKGFTKNPDLNKYANKVLFKDKVKKANQILEKVGLPKT